MDYKKTNAPATTVTRDMMELCADTGNVYETVAIIGKRANQISVEIKNDLSKKLAEFALTMTTWKKCLKIESKSKFLVIMRNCRNLTWLLHRNTSKGKFIIEIRLRRKKNFSNLFSDEEFDSQVVSGMIIPTPYCLAIIV